MENPLLMFQICEDSSRCAVRGKNLNGMRIEGQHPDLATPPGGIDDRLVAQVHAIKNTESQTEV